MRFRRGTDLQTMCLNVVVDNINIFTSSSEGIKVYIEFLRRCYSDRLFKLIKKKCMKSWYKSHTEPLVWLLSRHWKNVILPGSNYSFPDVVLRFKAIGSSITSLTLEDSSCSFGILAAIVCCVENITFLNISGTQCTDEVLLLIRKMCPLLKALNLSNCKMITSNGLKYLCNLENEPTGFPSLKALNIANTYFPTQSIVLILKHLTSLQVLYYDSLTISTILHHLHKSDVGNASNNIKYNITNFEFCTTLTEGTYGLKPVLEVCTVICPYISHVFVQDNISESVLELLSKFNCLRNLRIINKLFTTVAISISSFLKVRGEMITQLELFQLSISADVITKSCPNLKCLFLSSMVFENFQPPVIMRKLKHLEELTIKHMALNQYCTLKSIDLLLRSSENLNELCIQYTKCFTDSVADLILSVPHLFSVDFSFTDITLPTLLRFFYHPDIKRICTDGCPCISLNDKESVISKLLNESQYGNTCSWEIDYGEFDEDPSWHCSIWSMKDYTF